MQLAIVYLKANRQCRRIIASCCGYSCCCCCRCRCRCGWRRRPPRRRRRHGGGRCVCCLLFVAGVCLFLYLFVFVCLLVCLFACLLVCLFACLLVCLFACCLLLVCLLLACLLAWLVGWLFVCLFVCLLLFVCCSLLFVVCLVEFVVCCSLLFAVLFIARADVQFPNTLILGARAKPKSFILLLLKSVGFCSMLKLFGANCLVFAMFRTGRIARTWILTQNTASKIPTNSSFAACSENSIKNAKTTVVTEFPVNDDV